MFDNFIMKNIKKNILGILILIFIFCIGAFFVIFFNTYYLNKNVANVNEEKCINNIGNIMNYGYVGYDDKNIYYYTFKHNELKKIDNNNVTTTLYKGYCSYINVYKNYIYFVNDDLNICKININDLKVENAITDKKIDYLYIKDDKLYAVCRKDNDKKQQIVSVDLVNNDVNIILDDVKIDQMLVYNDKIYYSYQEQLFCSDDINNSIIENVEGGNGVEKFFIVDNDVYFLNGLILGKLKKYNMETQKCENFLSYEKYNKINMPCLNFNDDLLLFEKDGIISDKLYVYNFKNKSEKIYSLDLKIRNKNDYTLFIARDKLVYYNDNDIYISNLNGKNVRKIE